MDATAIHDPSHEIYAALSDDAGVECIEHECRQQMPNLASMGSLPIDNRAILS